MAIAGGDYVIAEIIKVQAYQLCNITLILDDENSLWHPPPPKVSVIQKRTGRSAELSQWMRLENSRERSVSDCSCCDQSNTRRAGCCRGCRLNRSQRTGSSGHSK